MSKMIYLYCHKCKATRGISEFEIITLKNNRIAGKGKCNMCDSKLYGFLPKEDKPVKEMKVAKNEEIKKDDLVVQNKNGEVESILKDKKNKPQKKKKKSKKKKKDINAQKEIIEVKKTTSNRKPTIKEEIESWNSIQP